MLTFKAHTKSIYSLAFSHDGTRLATSSHDEVVRVWDLVTPTEPRQYPGSYYDAAVAFSPDGRFLARGGMDFALLELNDGTSIVAGGRCDTIRFAPDGEEVAAFGVDELLARWSLPKGKALPGGWGGPRTRTRFPTGAVAYSPNGKVIATSYGVFTGNRFDSYLLLWDRETGKLRGELVADFKHDHPAAIAYSPDGAVIAGIYGPVLGVVDVANGTKVAAIKPSKKHFKGLAFTPDGKRLIAVNTDAAVRVYDTATWTETTGYEWQIGKLTAVAVAPDGLRAACGSDRGRVVVWDIEV